MAAGAGLLPITLRRGSVGHRLYAIVPWMIAIGAIVYVPLATDVGFTPGSIQHAVRIGQINTMIAFAVAILGLSMAIGWSGQLALGQSAFVGMGAYTTVILVTDHHWNYLATLPVSAVVCFVAGLILGIPATRIRGMYLGVVTFAVAYAFPPIVLKYSSLTGGVNGKGPHRTDAKLLPPTWMPFADAGRLAGPLWVYCLSIAIAAVLFLAARNFHRSRPGRALLATRDNEASALSVGVDIAWYKAMTFGVSAVYGGIAGSMLMMTRAFATNEQYGTTMAIFLVVALVVGGSGTIAGAVPGAFFYVFVPYYVSQWTFDQSGMPIGLRQITAPLFSILRPGGGAAVGIVFGLTLLFLMFVLPSGVVGGIRRVRARIIQVEPRPPWLTPRPHHGHPDIDAARDGAPAEPMPAGAVSRPTPSGRRLRMGVGRTP